MSTTIKVTGPNDDTRRFQLPTQQLTAAFLHEKCGELFGLASARLLWRDEESDLITLANDNDLQEALDAREEDKALRRPTAATPGQKMHMCES